MSADEAIGASHVAKRYGDCIATADVSVSVARGTIHGLIGENGAGKSTLLSALYGLIPVDEGEIRQGGERFSPGRLTVTGSIRRGIGLVHQHFMLVPSMTVVENVVLGQEPLARGLVDLAKAARELDAIGKKFGLDLAPDAVVESLGVGARQRLEIAKVLWRGARVLLLDEPTAVLAPTEVEGLFAVLQGLVKEGRTIVLTSHKLDEIVALCSRVTVLQKGRVVAERAVAGASTAELSALVLGQELVSAAPRSATVRKKGAVRLQCGGVTVGSALVDVTLEVAAGEIVGIAGVEGNGQSELVELLGGLLAADAGQVLVDGRDITGQSAAQRRRAGLRLCPEDRLHGGLVPSFGAAENVLLGRSEKYAAAPFGLAIDRQKLAGDTAQIVAAYDVRAPTYDTQVALLSGGNQQKILVGRELADAPDVFLCAQPTRGVDVGAAALIHRALMARADAGAAVLVVSADLDELLLLCDRIAVLHRGRVVGQVALAGAPEDRPALRDRIGRLMLGAA